MRELNNNVLLSTDPCHSLLFVSVTVISIITMIMSMMVSS